jgi:hypothetical protein
MKNNQSRLWHVNSWNMPIFKPSDSRNISGMPVIFSYELIYVPSMGLYMNRLNFI